MPKLKYKYKKELKRIIEYMISGGAQFWSGYGAFALFDIVFKVPFWPNRVLSYGLGVMVNFYLQRYWVFGRKRLSKKQIHASAEKYYGLMFTNFLIDLAIVGGLYELADVSPYIGQFVSAGFFTVYNYLLFKYWVFKKKSAEPHDINPARKTAMPTLSTRPPKKRSK